MEYFYALLPLIFGIFLFSIYYFSKRNLKMSIWILILTILSHYFSIIIWNQTYLIYLILSIFLFSIFLLNRKNSNKRNIFYIFLSTSMWIVSWLFISFWLVAFLMWVIVFTLTFFELAFFDFALKENEVLKEKGMERIWI